MLKSTTKVLRHAFNSIPQLCRQSSVPMCTLAPLETYEQHNTPVEWARINACTRQIASVRIRLSSSVSLMIRIPSASIYDKILYQIYRYAGKEPLHASSGGQDLVASGEDEVEKPPCVRHFGARGPSAVAGSTPATSA